ncbi:MAG: O-antigen ligase family protein [Pseudomonadota bacterium]
MKLAHALPLLFIAAPTLTALHFYFLTERTAFDSYAPVNLRILFQLPLLGVALWLGFSGKALEGQMPKPVKLALWVLIAAILWGLALNAVEPFVGVVSLMLRGLNVMLALMLIYVIHRAGEGLRRQLILAIPLAYALHFAVVLAMLPGLLASPQVDWLNSPPGIFQVRLWGMSLTAALAVAVVLGASHGAARRVWPLLLALSLATALCYTGTRAALPALAVGFGVTALIVGRPLWRAGLLLLAVLALGALLSLPLPVPHPAYGLISSYQETMGAQNVDQVSAGRVEIWLQAIEIWQNHPVFGIGYDQFRYWNWGRFEGFNQPHNAVIEFFLVFGLVGGLAMLTILAWLWVRACGATRAQPTQERIAALFALNALLALSLLDGTLYQQDTLQMFAVLWACLLARPSGPGGQAKPPAL